MGLTQTCVLLCHLLRTCCGLYLLASESAILLTTQVQVSHITRLSIESCAACLLTVEHAIYAWQHTLLVANVVSVGWGRFLRVQ